MNLFKILNFGLLSCGLVGILMLGLAVLAFLKGRHKLNDKAGILIIAAVLIGTMLALSVGQY